MKAHRHRCSALLAAVALSFSPGCVPSPDVDAEVPAAQPVARFQLTAEQRDDLLFPALRETQPTPRCATKTGGHTAPAWLEQALADLTCTKTLRELVHAAPEAACAAPPCELQDRLTAAALCDDPVAVRRCLADGARPNGHDSCGSTALVAAASAGRRRAVHELLEAGANPNTSSRQGPGSRTPLLAAAMSGHSAAATALLAAGAEPSAVTRQGRDALMFATANDDDALVRKLLRRRADACRRDQLGWTATEIARVFGVQRVGGMLQEASRKCARTRKGPS